MTGAPTTITALTVGHILAAMEAGGMDPELEAMRLGLPATLEPEFDWRVPVDSVEALLQRGIARLGPDFPLAARPASPATNRSPVNLYCRTRSSVRDGFLAMVELCDLVTDDYSWVFEESQEGGHLTWVGPPRPALWWFDAADSISSMKTVLGSRAKLVRMETPFGGPPSAEALFGCPVVAGSRFQMVLSPALVEIRLTVDPALQAMTERWLARVRPPKAGTNALIAALRALGPTATVSQLAASMGMSERTLHRRLAESGTSFRAELDTLRAELAQSMSGQRPAEEIAALLGYSDSRAYRRAARRWGLGS
jgi:AraC-like DNA-binding protein